jgi:hypothetical protein
LLHGSSGSQSFLELNAYRSIQLDFQMRWRMVWREEREETEKNKEVKRSCKWEALDRLS